MGALVNRRTNSIGIIERVACWDFLRIWTALAATASLSAGAASLDPNKSISQFAHTSWTAKDGIPGPVRAIAQTKDGYLWFGTPAGLLSLRWRAFRFLGGTSRRRSAPAQVRCDPSCASDGSLWIGFQLGTDRATTEWRLANLFDWRRIESRCLVVRGGLGRPHLGWRRKRLRPI